MARRKRITPLVSKDEAKQRHDLIDGAIQRFQGHLDELESAIGMYMIGRHVGWKVLYLIHTARTIKKYEDILGVSLTDVCEPFGPDAESTNAFKALQTVESFWKVVSGNEKLSLTRDERRTVT